MKNTIAHLHLDEKALVRSDHYKQQRERAITDLLKENSFTLAEKNGPFTVYLSIAENRLVLEITNGTDEKDAVSVPLTPLRRVIKDYAIICESYFDAVKTADPRKVEAIDMGRRGVHNEGAELLSELLAKHITLDFETSRKLFALICLLQMS